MQHPLGALGEPGAFCAASPAGKSAARRPGTGLGSGGDTVPLPGLAPPLSPGFRSTCGRSRGQPELDFLAFPRRRRGVAVLGPPVPCSQPAGPGLRDPLRELRAAGSLGQPVSARRAQPARAHALSHTWAERPGTSKPAFFALLSSTGWGVRNGLGSGREL